MHKTEHYNAVRRRLLLSVETVKDVTESMSETVYSWSQKVEDWSKDVDYPEKKAAKEKGQEIETFTGDANTGAGWLNSLTKGKPWRGGMQVIMELRKDDTKSRPKV